MPAFSHPVLAWTAGILLAAYAVGILCALTAPVKQHDPQRGQAVGCLMIVLAGLLVLGASLAAGVYWGVAVLVWVPFAVTVFPAVCLVGSAVYHLVSRLRGRN
jgi:hypothetical protein